MDAIKSDPETSNQTQNQKLFEGLENIGLFFVNSLSLVQKQLEIIQHQQRSILEKLNNDEKRVSQDEDF